MAFFRGDITSAALEMATGVQVILPEQGDNAELNVIYLFHGLSDNCSNWTRLTGLERYVRKLPVAVVIPEVQRSYYADMAYGPAYFTYVSQELPQLAHSLFGLPTDREHSYVMGLSMGGYGALKCGLTNPGQYAGIAAFSSAVDAKKLAERCPEDSPIHRELPAIFGTEIQINPENDLLALAEKAAAAPARPRVFLTCGRQDSLQLLPQNQELEAALKRLHYDVEARYWDGDHTWELWDKSLRQALEYFFG